MATLIPIELIASKIYLIRNVKVMLDRDLAELYGVETKVLKQAVRRNIDRFPTDFMFELTKNEYQSLRSQIVTLKRGQHSKYAPFAFTEHGVLMLSSVLNSERAIQATSKSCGHLQNSVKRLLTIKTLERSWKNSDN